MAIHGKTIVLTRAATQSHALREELEARGAIVLDLPTIEITPPEDWRDLDRALDRLDAFTWIVFTSQNAVDAFLGRSPQARLPKVAAIGRATAERLRRLGASVSLLPSEANALGLLSELPANLQSESFLIPRGSLARDVLPEGLRRRGAHVETVTVYQTKVPVSVSPDVLNRLEGGVVDMITFTSPSTVENLQSLLDVPLAQALQSCAIAAIGPTTADTLARLKIPVQVRPRNATVTSLVDAIVTYFEER